MLIQWIYGYFPVNEFQVDLMQSQQTIAHPKRFHRFFHFNLQIFYGKIDEIVFVQH